MKFRLSFIPLEIPRRSAGRVGSDHNFRGGSNTPRKFLTGFIASGIAIFIAPFIEAAVLVVPVQGLGAVVFPFVAIFTSLVLPLTVLVWLCLAAAAWRDIMFLLPMAPTLMGVAVLLLMVALSRYLLTNRSILSELVTVALAYLGYATGLVLSVSLAHALGEPAVINISAPAWVTGLGGLLLVTAVLRRTT